MNTMTQHPISPLRQRMIEEMEMRKLSPKTQSGYIRCIKKFARYLHRSPDTASAEELRAYQLFMVQQGASSGTINGSISALRFLFEKTLKHPDLMIMMSTVHEPRKLPIILSPEEVHRLLESAHNIKYRAALSVAYSAGLRISEIVALKISDVDSKRMNLRVERGKGKKDRYAMLSPVLLQCLRDWWSEGHRQGKVLHQGWLFPGQKIANHLTARQLSRAFHAAAEKAHIEKHVSMHTLRHSFATHLLEKKVDIRVIQVLLGHKKLNTTALYTQVATKLLHEVISPLDCLST